MRAFLGLADYYMHFIHNYGAIAAPLTCLLKKEGVCWTPEVEEAFCALQHVLMSALVL
jgi:hypothetical protein